MSSLQNMNYEIVKTEQGKFALYVNGEFVKDYTRKSSAIRGYERLIASLGSVESGCADAQTDSACAAGCGAVQPPPTSNTGGQNFKPVKQGGVSHISEIQNHYVMVNGEIKAVPLRKGVGMSAHIDTITITFSKYSLLTLEQSVQCESEDAEDELVLANAETMLFEIFGFYFSSRGNGRNGYPKTANMGLKSDERIKYGFFGWGNGDKQGGTVCIYVSGVGLTAALDGWENRLYDWIKDYAPSCKITRIDLAHDFLKGEYTPLQAYSDWAAGKFKSGNTQPNAEMAGVGWLNAPDGGRTLYIGSRKNGSRVVRVYEKGIEQGDRSSPWVRFELQMRNRDIVLEHDILLNPGEYLTGAYPICEELFSQYSEDLKKPDRLQKMKEISVEHMLYHASIQVSPTIKTLKFMGFEEQEIVQLLENVGAKMNKRLHPNAFDAGYPFVEFIKENKRKPSDIDLRNYIFEKKLVESEIQQEQKPKVNTEELKQFRNNLKSDLFLRAVFGKGFTRELQESMTYDEYLHLRYGQYKQQNLNPKHKETS